MYETYKNVRLRTSSDGVIYGLVLFSKRKLSERSKNSFVRTEGSDL